MFFCEYCKISNNTLFEKHLRMAVSEATGQNDHYMINMDGQRPKTGGNWPLTDLYLQRWICQSNMSK